MSFKGLGASNVSATRRRLRNISARSKTLRINDGRPEINPRPTTGTLRHYFCGYGICRARINARASTSSGFSPLARLPARTPFPEPLPESKSATDVEHDAAFTGIPEASSTDRAGNPIF